MKRFLPAVVIVGMTVGLAVGAIEVGLQVVKARTDIRRGRRMAQLSSNPELGYDLKPGWRQGRIAINHAGFRGPEFSDAKPDGTYRIAGLGDSIPFGAYLDDSDTYLRRIEQALNRRPGMHPRVEVLNASVGGYDIVQYGETYRTKVRKLKPDMVIVSICQNDFALAGPYRLDRWGIVRDSYEEAGARI